MSWRRRIEPFTRPIFFAVSRMTRGMTLGVRAVVTDRAGRVLLVKHTYLPGWWLPGGGVDRGETVQAAAVRELREEAGLIATGEPVLVSVHSNERFFPGDHVLVFRIDGFEVGERTSHGEIEAVEWFDLNALPEDVNRGCAARLAEMFGGVGVSRDW